MWSPNKSLILLLKGTIGRFFRPSPCNVLPITVSALVVCASCVSLYLSDAVGEHVARSMFFPNPPISVYSQENIADDLKALIPDIDVKTYEYGTGFLYAKNEIIPVSFTTLHAIDQTVSIDRATKDTVSLGDTYTLQVNGISTQITPKAFFDPPYLSSTKTIFLPDHVSYNGHIALGVLCNPKQVTKIKQTLGSLGDNVIVRTDVDDIDIESLITQINSDSFLIKTIACLTTAFGCTCCAICLMLLMLKHRKALILADELGCPKHHITICLMIPSVAFSLIGGAIGVMMSTCIVSNIDMLLCIASSITGYSYTLSIYTPPPHTYYTSLWSTVVIANTFICALFSYTLAINFRRIVDFLQ